MPRSSVTTLENLCVCSLVFNWEKITVSKDSQLLKCLPEYLLHEIRRQLTFAKGRLSFHDFLLINCRPFVHVYLKDYSFSKSESLEVIQHLTPMSWRMKKLTFSNNSLKFCIPSPSTSTSPHSIALERFLENLNKLESLNFKSTPCQNWMLKTVARFCPFLLELNLSYCTDVDDDGISTFCNDVLSITSENDFNHNEYVTRNSFCDIRRIWLVNTKVTSAALFQLFITFPHLELCHHPDLLNSVYFLTGPTWSLTEARSFENVDLKPLLTDVVCHSTWLPYLEVPSCLTSSISCLELSGLTSDINLTFLAQLKNLTALTLISCPVERKCELDLNLLANSCTILRHLTLKVKGPLILTRSFTARAFQSLESLHVDSGGSTSLSATDALRLLASCTKLSRLCLDFCPWLTDKILDDLLRRNPLASAKEVCFHGSKLSFDGILRLLHLPNEMKLLSIGTELVGKRHYIIVNNYIRKKNWQLLLRLQTATSSVD